MAKWCGTVGYRLTVETEPGIWEEQVIEKTYFGDLLRNTSRFQSSGGVIDNISLDNQISIVADPFANANYYAMKYVEIHGAKWSISKVEVQYPRLLLTVGGLYNGDSLRATE